MSDTARVYTTQNVTINYEMASVGERILARLLDLVFFTAFLFITFYVLGNLAAVVHFRETSSRATVFFLTIILPLLPVLTYTLWCEPLLNGRSLGKLILRLKVVKTDGTPAGVGEAAYRWLTRIVEGEIAIFTFLAVPVAIVTERNQRVGDLVAGTMVIRTKQKSTLSHTILSRINPNYRVVFPQVSALSDRDVNIIRDVMQQAFETGNFPLLEYLGHKVKTVLGVCPPPQQLPTTQFLNIVLADYTHYNFAEK